MKQNDNNRQLVVSLCDFTGAMVAPWLEYGVDAAIVDPQHLSTSDERMQSGAVLTRISAIIDSDEVSLFSVRICSASCFWPGSHRVLTWLFPARAGFRTRLIKIRFSSSKQCRLSGSVMTLQR